MELIITKCEFDDVKPLKELYKECYLFHEKRGFKLIKTHEAPDLFAEYVLDHLNDQKSLILVAKYCDEVVGYCFARILEKPPVYTEHIYGEIDNISVLEKYQRRGIGKNLFLKTLNWFKTNNIQFIEVGVTIGNEKSNSFWEKMGFESHMKIKLMEIPDRE
ncbi:GNAT family N-acetyltransferase [Methanobacterium alcaliphilum]|uniref:GNAT family N-acetyltransferase n=1 Tax=Methanobacterium alcaliphilum TaxID=392018 RepID=UPI00200ABA9D|nr:GNAT family N-acetyltransferase [Methanobacterium alcaliphilum]MCK9151924.1 GNAT family N-acetyltransferase [Methanobacterium alcaliphilum]